MSRSDDQRVADIVEAASHRLSEGSKGERGAAQREER